MRKDNMSSRHKKHCKKSRLYELDAEIDTEKQESPNPKPKKIVNQSRCKHHVLMSTYEPRFVARGHYHFDATVHVCYECGKEIALTEKELDRYIIREPKLKEIC